MFIIWALFGIATIIWGVVMFVARLLIFPVRIFGALGGCGLWAGFFVLAAGLSLIYAFASTHVVWVIAAVLALVTVGIISQLRDRLPIKNSMANRPRGPSAQGFDPVVEEHNVRRKDSQVDHEHVTPDLGAVAFQQRTAKSAGQEILKDRHEPVHKPGLVVWLESVTARMNASTARMEARRQAMRARQHEAADKPGWLESVTMRMNASTARANARRDADIARMKADTTQMKAELARRLGIRATSQAVDASTGDAQGPANPTEPPASD